MFSYHTDKKNVDIKNNTINSRMISSRHIWLWHCLHTFSPCSKYSKKEKEKCCKCKPKKWMSCMFPFGLCIHIGSWLNHSKEMFQFSQFFPRFYSPLCCGWCARATHSPQKLLQQTSITVCLSFSKCDCFVGDKCEIVALKG